MCGDGEIDDDDDDKEEEDDDDEDDDCDDDKRSGFVTVAKETYGTDDFLNGSTVFDVDDKNVR